MERPLAYPRGKEEKAETQKEGKNSKVEQTLGHLGVVKPVTSEEDVPLRGWRLTEKIEKISFSSELPTSVIPSEHLLTTTFLAH
ncbi:hypothetical protein AVEN_85891-1 [Araneus ventricosus]|uniref:Uncharacterized protein n=1 Tax=Araneus ventricosus TaxID=182803 RepID=A0A4Y2LT43_ARAVE|nr:hypothetical protein AVEN_85891-1 [Araneus ventricosus]